MIKKVIAAALTILTAAAVGCAWTPAPAAAAVTASWQYQLNWPIDTSVNASVFDIDWNAAESGASVQQLAAVVSTLHAKGAKVICYVDTGGWENYRADADSYPEEILGNTVGGWPDERYVDVRRWDVLSPILEKRFQQCSTAGFDGVETDLDDQYLADTGFGLTKMDYVLFVQRMSVTINRLGMDWYLKNGITGDDFIQLVEPYAAGTVNESCWTYNECGWLAPFRESGKPIYNVEYTGSQSRVCPRAQSFPTRTVRKEYNLNSRYVWSCR